MKRFAQGEIVYWKSRASNRELPGVVVRHLCDEVVLVRDSTLPYSHPIRAERLCRPQRNVTLCGSGNVV